MFDSLCGPPCASPLGHTQEADRALPAKAQEARRRSQNFVAGSGLVGSKPSDGGIV